MDEDQRKQIDVLLKEYDALRAELRDRLNHRFAALGVFLALMGLSFRPPIDRAAFTIAGLGTAVLAGVYLFTVVVMRNLGSRLCVVERRVNELAGADLLTWESSVQASALYRIGMRWTPQSPAPSKGDLGHSGLSGKDDTQAPRLTSGQSLSDESR